MHLSLVIPAYNEAAKIRRDLEAAKDFLSAQPFDSEILIVNDGSKDATQSVAEKFASRESTPKVRVEVLTYGANRGKGYAVRHGVRCAKGKNVAFVDAGLCVPLPFLLKGLEKIEQGADFAIASRRLRGTRIVQKQPLYRRWGSQVFWVVVRGFMGVPASDTQCGFKVYSAHAAEKIFSRVATDGFMFDIEALIVAKKLGLKAAEFAVEWSNDSDTRYHPVWGTLRNMKELAKIRLRTVGGIS